MSELQEQLRDVMFYLEAKNTLASADGATQQEIQDGQIIVQPAAGAEAMPPNGHKKTRNRKR